MNETRHLSSVRPESGGEVHQYTEARRFYVRGEKLIQGQWKHRGPGMGQGLVAMEGLIEEVAVEMSLGT